VRQLAFHLLWYLADCRSRPNGKQVGGVFRVPLSSFVHCYETAAPVCTYLARRIMSCGECSQNCADSNFRGDIVEVRTYWKVNNGHTYFLAMQTDTTDTIFVGTQYLQHLSISCLIMLCSCSAGDTLVSSNPNKPFYSSFRINRSATSTPRGAFRPATFSTGAFSPAFALETVCDNQYSEVHCTSLFTEGKCKTASANDGFNGYRERESIEVRNIYGKLTQASALCLQRW
jgi:hypothetical protein